MKWDNVKNIIGTSAPILGGLLGGPAGAGIGTIISSLLGVENTPLAISNELTNNPDAFIKLKEYEFKHKEHLETLQLEETKAHLADVQSARKRQTETEEATGEKDYNLYVLAWTIVIGYFGLIYFLVTESVPDDATGVVYMLFGTLATAFGGVIQYFFGSSKGSKEKTIQLANIKKGS